MNQEQFQLAKYLSTRAGLFSTRADIYFYQMDEAAVFYETSALPGFQQEFGDTVMFTAFARRHLSNLLKAGRVEAMAREGVQVLVEALASLTPEVLGDASRSDEFVKIKLIRYPGNAGRKGYKAKIQADFRKVDIKLDLWPHGFGLFGLTNTEGVYYYLPNSIFTLLHFFLKRYASDPSAIERFRLAAQGLAYYTLQGMVADDTKASAVVSGICFQAFKDVAE